MSTDRQAWMKLLALAPPELVQDGLGTIGALPPYELTRAPEVGLVMVRGRIGGTGDPFNLGEMTVTRATVVVEGTAGFACVAGRSPRHAELAALCDGLLQIPAWSGRLREEVLVPAGRVLAERRTRRARERAATKAEFVTVVRSGEN